MGWLVEPKENLIPNKPAVKLLKTSGGERYKKIDYRGLEYASEFTVFMMAAA